MSDPHQPIPAEILETASAWLARRDRGLSAAEQDDYMQWLRADPRHAEALQQHAAALERMMQLYEWTPANDTEPNPDLFALPPARSRAGRRWAYAGLAAAAAIAFVFVFTRPTAESNALATAPKSHLRVNERLALPDGSRVELKDGTQLVVQYSETERRVKLTGGEAHFSVWKDKARPFVVEASGVEVRAVGTAFNVRLGARDVQVLVTEGRVTVEQPAVPATPPAFVSVGETAKVPLETAASPTIAFVTPEDIARELAWQAPRLEFNETPLADAVAEFNRLNRHQIEFGDPALGALRIGGTFRPDNIEGFIRMLVADPAFAVRAEPAGENRTVLRRAR
ncbi:MAG: FecR domain-containing protein [Opitutae bacterium]|nr:FecR domain-containing protein [Opitutae bacterium]